MSGQFGHDRTFHVACVLVLGFNLAPDNAWPVFIEWNQKCEPQWDESDLRRKLDEADKQPGERGYLLRQGSPAQGSNGAPNRGGQIDQHGPVGEPFKSPVLVRLDTIEPEEIDWLWQGRIALGKLSALAGQAGLSKSLVTLNMTATVTNGGLWPCGEGRAEAGDVIILSGEDTARDVILPRVIEAGGDRSRVHVFEAVRQQDPESDDPLERQFSLSCDLDVLEAAITSVPNPRLLIIDPIGTYLGRGTDSHRDADVRSVLAPLGTLAAKHNIAVLVVCHLNKSTGASAQDRIVGSIAFSAIARAVWMVGRDKDDPLRRWMSCAKTTLAGINWHCPTVSS